MNDRPNAPDDAAGEEDPSVTSALRAMPTPEHGDAFWDRLDANLRAEPAAPTTAVPVAAPPLPPVAEVVPLPAPRRSQPPAPWIAAAAAVLLVAGGAIALVGTAGTDVETTPAATGVPAEPTTAAPATTYAPPPTGPLLAPSTTTRQAPPTSAAPRTTTTARPARFTLSPEGLGPLRLGMTPRQARATGAASGYEEPQGPGCGFSGPAGPYRTGDFVALFLEDKLVRFYVSPGSRLRTPQGLGVGSPESSLGGVPGTRVDSPHPYQDTLVNVEITTGAVGYLFTIDDGKVSEWSVGTKDGLATPEGCS